MCYTGGAQKRLMKHNPLHHMPHFTKYSLALCLFGTLLLITLWLTWPTIQPELETLIESVRASPWRERILSYGLLAPVVSIMIVIIQVFPVPIPGPMIPIINGWLFGLWGGMGVSWVGLMLKAIVGYLLGLGGRRVTQSKERTRWARVIPYLERYGWQLIFFTRMIPLFPFTPISSGAALIGMSWRVYLLASGFGLLPLAFIYAWIGTWLD